MPTLEAPPGPDPTGDLPPPADGAGGGDGRHAAAGGLLAEHQGAARLLLRPVRRGRGAGGHGGPHAGPPGGHAHEREGGARTRWARWRRGTWWRSTTRSWAGPTSRTSRWWRRSPGARGREPLAYVAARAHHADVGGMTAGSMPLAREIYQEGLRIPPVRLVAGGASGTRTCGGWCWRTCVRRWSGRGPGRAAGGAGGGAAAALELVSRKGAGEVRSAMAGLLGVRRPGAPGGDPGDPGRGLRGRGLPGGRRGGRGSDPDPGPAHRSGDEVVGGLHRHRAAGPGRVNAVEAITASATRYALRVVVERLLGQPLPAGGGRHGALRLVAPPGTVVSARPPASVAGGNVETSQRITDVLLLALARRCRRSPPRSRRGP
jgi:hypothetical protein